jgi:hypothetical protein
LEPLSVLTFASLLAAMTIAGAFWVGVLAARRLRDWGEGRRALEEGHAPLALAAASSVIDDVRSRRVRDRVAEKLAGSTRSAAALPRSLQDQELGPGSLRVRDIVSIDAADPSVDGDHVVEGLLTLREGNARATVAIMADGGREAWLVAREGEERWLLVEPVMGHGLRGEPPREIREGGVLYGLERRGQASVASQGRHGRPEGTRVATYLYRASARDVLWVERWGNEILMGRGHAVPAHVVAFLPGS